MSMFSVSSRDRLMSHHQFAFKKKSPDKWKLKRKDRPAIKPSFKLKKVVKSQPFYFTLARGMDEHTARHVEQEASPFWCPSPPDQFAYRIVHSSWVEQMKKAEKKFRYFERPSFRVRQRQDILQRLFMRDEQAGRQVDYPSILDIDPEYFTIIQGRPERSKTVKVATYVQNVRDSLLTKLNAGFLEDEILKIDEQFIEEQRRIDEIRAAYQLYVDKFEQFLAEDHEESMMLLREAADYAKESALLEDEYRILQRAQAAITCRVYVLEEKWRDCKVFQRFLYRVSPGEWRAQYDYINKDEGLEGSSGSDREDRSIKSDMEAPSLDSLIDMFKEDCATEQPPLLYYTDPEQLLLVFEALEHQNLDSMIHMKYIVDPLESMKVQMIDAANILGQELTRAQNVVREMSSTILEAEKRARDLEESAHSLLEGQLKESVAGDDALNLYVFVEDAYEATVATNEDKKDMMLLMKGLEDRYMELLQQLEKYPKNLVKKVQRDVFILDRHRAEKAHEASINLRRMELLMYKTSRALGPVICRKKKMLMVRSKPVVMKKREREEKQVGEEVQDYLKYFTDFCEHTDDMDAYIQKEKADNVYFTIKKSR